MRTLELYTDGACSRGVGAWAFVAVRWSAGGELRVVDGRAGVERGATHQRMELTAFIGAVRHALDAHEPALIVTDSAFVGDCLLDGWWKRWVRNGWQNAKGQPVAYRDLWDELLGLLGTHAEFLATPGGRAEPRRFDRSPIQVRRVRGHGQGDDPTHDPYRAGNHLADRMAVAELKSGTAVLVTGMSGSGKTSVLHELARRGHRVVDTDVGGWIVDEPLPDGGSEPLWLEHRITSLLEEPRDGPLFVAGCVANQGRFYTRFTAVVLLSVPEDVLLERIATRTTNDFGKRSDERARILDDLRTVEPLLRAGATAEVDTRTPLAEVADILESIAASTA